MGPIGIQFSFSLSYDLTFFTLVLVGLRRRTGNSNKKEANQTGLPTAMYDKTLLFGKAICE